MRKAHFTFDSENSTRNPFKLCLNYVKYPGCERVQVGIDVVVCKLLAQLDMCVPQFFEQDGEPTRKAPAHSQEIRQRDEPKKVESCRKVNTLPTTTASHANKISSSSASN